MNFHGILMGLLLIAAGALTAGSFAIPFGKIKDWKWETYWLVYCFGSYTLFPVIACVVFAPGFLNVYREVPSEILHKVFLLGAVYGIGNLSFGLSLRYLGISLGYTLSLGLMLAIGTLIPPLMNGQLKVMIESSGGSMLIIGVLTSCIGIGLSGWVGFLKDKIISDADKKKSVTEFNLIKGIMAALLVGITGSAMSLGFEEGQEIAVYAEKAGINSLYTTMPVMLIMLSGTLLTTVIWCVYLGVKNKSLINFLRVSSQTRLGFNYLFGFLAGLLWFSQFILYSMGKSKMGKYTFISWGILMGLTIVFATLWGIYRKEWKGAPLKIYLFMIISLLIIIGSSFLIGISGSL